MPTLTSYVHADMQRQMEQRFREYDFLDFGCSGGSSMTWVQRLFPTARGLGLDLDPNKIIEARQSGYDAELCDIATLTTSPAQVQFVVMSHFLEHLPGREVALECLRVASTVAREFIVIRQPWFDADGYLFGAGLKFYWSDWWGHRYHMTALELQQCMRSLMSEGAIKQFALYGRKLVRDSSDQAIHPLSSPADQHGYDETAHDPKPTVNFSIPVYRELCAIAIRDGWGIDELARRFKFETSILRSDAPFATMLNEGGKD